MEDAAVARLRDRYPVDLTSVPRVVVTTPNSAGRRAVLQELRPDLAIARCKVILKRENLRDSACGRSSCTLALPGYRNAHGCFWALVNRALDRVGMTR